MYSFSEMLAKMPVVIGQAMVVLCFFALPESHPFDKVSVNRNAADIVEVSIGHGRLARYLLHAPPVKESGLIGSHQKASA